MTKFNKNKKIYRLSRRIFSNKVLWLSLLLFGIGVLGIFLKTKFLDPRDNQVIFKVLDTVFVTLTGVAIIPFIWELFLKRTFFNEILEKINLSKELEEYGVENISGVFNNIDWEDFYKNGSTYKLLIYHLVYTKSNQSVAFEKMASRKHVKIEVILPDNKERMLLQAIVDIHKGDNVSTLRANVTQAIDWLEKLNIKPILSKKPFPFSIYISEFKAILILNKGMNFNDMMGITVKNSGNLYTFLNELYDESKK